MKKTIRPIIGALMALAICLTLLPVQAFAISAADYEKKYCTVTSKVTYCKVAANSLDMWTLPATSSQYSGSSKITTISKNARVTTSKLVTNNNTNYYWWCVTYNGKTGYIYAMASGSSGTATLADCFLEDCTTYNSHVSLTVNKSTPVKALPCHTGRTITPLL